MKKSSIGNEICIRSGGDEFVILASNYDEEKVKSLIDNIRSRISKSCKKDNKPFDISISIGCYLTSPEKDSDKSITEISEEYLRNADELMYIEKKEHKKKK